MTYQKAHRGLPDGQWMRVGNVWRWFADDEVAYVAPPMALPTRRIELVYRPTRKRAA